MAWVNAPNTYWITLGYHCFDAIAMNSIYFHLDEGDVSRPHAHSVAAAINNWAKDNIMPSLSSELTLVNVAAIDMTTETSFTEFVINFGGFAGSAGPMLPLVCGKRIYFHTGEPGRSFRGSNTVPGVPKDVQSINSVTLEFVDALVAAYELLPDIAASFGCTWVVCSRHTGGADRPEAVNTPITSVAAQHLFVDFWEQRKPFAHTTSP